MLHNEIKGMQVKMEDVQKDAEICASSIKVSFDVDTLYTKYIFTQVLHRFVTMALKVQ